MSRGLGHIFISLRQCRGDHIKARAEGIRALLSHGVELARGTAGSLRRRRTETRPRPQKATEGGVCVGSRGSIRGYELWGRLRKKACAGHCAMQRIGAAFRASLGSRGVTRVLPTNIREVGRLRKGETRNELKDWHGWYCVGSYRTSSSAAWRDKSSNADKRFSTRRGSHG